MIDYPDFFERLTGHPPFPYQERLAADAWPEIIDVPTGLGKTAAIMVAWLHRRLSRQGQPRRLVYCLPMRTLVEQTQRSAEAWCERARPEFEKEDQPLPSVHVLMGGALDETWERHPERPAILIGTQDMLLSRALNRGYAMSRYRWPVQFGLVNNDVLWALDETQLMGVGVETSAQLAAFRRFLGTLGPTHTVWMSATVGQAQLDTVDHPCPAEGRVVHRLEPADRENDVVRRRTSARKPLRPLNGLRLDKQTEAGYATAVAREVLAQHAERKGLTLVVVNRVARAQSIHLRIRREAPDLRCALIHSRFRSSDRLAQEETLHDAAGDRIVVATQAVEAGVDVSSRTLITELAPWPSLVQRLGRCNRYGADQAAAFWIDIDTEDTKSDRNLPYEPNDLAEARHLLERLAQAGGDAGPEGLDQIEHEPRPVVRPVLRRRDLLDLFDTTPDLSGQDLDVSRWVRDGDDSDVQIYWRGFDERPDASADRPRREELCRVSLAATRSFLASLSKKRRALATAASTRTRRARLTPWRWNPLERAWQAADRVFAGQVLLLHPEAGGYSSELGWTGEAAGKEQVAAVAVRSPAAPQSDDSLDADAETAIGTWVSLREHLADAQREAEQLCRDLPPLCPFERELATAALWHDVGKAHDQFQQRLTEPVANEPSLRPPRNDVWAKSSHRLSWSEARPHFRHELASALAWLAAGGNADELERDLVAYLVAAHHGKVRLSIRSVPGEQPPHDRERLFARGIWDGDVLPAITLGDGRELSAIELDLGAMQLGPGSWLERMLALRDRTDLGPFRLALLESAVRIADWRASGSEEHGSPEQEADHA